MDYLNRQEEFYELMQELSIFHNVFLALWKMSTPIFVDHISTAAVSFDQDGKCLNFLFNPEFWDSIDPYTKSFVICHECLHVILNHGVRSKGAVPSLANVALDVAVNHMLVNNFDFDRSRIADWDTYCWVDTVFKEDKYNFVTVNENFEYYYDILSRTKIDISSLLLVDNHDELPEEIQDIIDEIKNQLSEEDIKDFQEKLDEGGKGKIGENLITGTATDIFKEKEKKVAKFWDKVLKDIKVKEIIKTQSSFVFKNRRLANLNSSFMIPNEYETEIRGIIKPDIHLYLDCSGSCHNLRQLFFDLGKTIDPKKYNVRLFARTTQVKEMFKNKAGSYIVNAIGGSDDFRCIENHIQKELKEGKIKQYPVVIHFTDGGDCSGVMVEPEKPERWYWMLHGTNKQWVPKACEHVYDISQIV
jgi:predicted metal-dependent peptidase